MPKGEMAANAPPKFAQEAITPSSWLRSISSTSMIAELAQALETVVNILDEE